MSSCVVTEPHTPPPLPPPPPHPPPSSSGSLTSPQANQRIRLLAPRAGALTALANDGLTGYVGAPYLTTYAGDGQQAWAGDNGPATDAALNNPTGVAVDASGDVFIAETVGGPSMGCAHLARSRIYSYCTVLKSDPNVNPCRAMQGNHRVRRVAHMAGGAYFCGLSAPAPSVFLWCVSESLC